MLDTAPIGTPCHSSGSANTAFCNALCIPPSDLQVASVAVPSSDCTTETPDPKGMRGVAVLQTRPPADALAGRLSLESPSGKRSPGLRSVALSERGGLGTSLIQYAPHTDVCRIAAHLCASGRVRHTRTHYDGSGRVPERLTQVQYKRKSQCRGQSQNLLFHQEGEIAPPSHQGESQREQSTSVVSSMRAANEGAVCARECMSVNKSVRTCGNIALASLSTTRVARLRDDVPPAVLPYLLFVAICNLDTMPVCRNAATYHCAHGEPGRHTRPSIVPTPRYVPSCIPLVLLPCVSKKHRGDQRPLRPLYQTRDDSQNFDRGTPHFCALAQKHDVGKPFTTCFRRRPFRRRNSFSHRAFGRWNSTPPTTGSDETRCTILTLSTNGAPGGGVAVSQFSASSSELSLTLASS